MRGACDPNFTVNYGVRYDMQFPFIAKNNSYSIGDYDDVFGVSGAGNIFKPGLDGTPPTFRQLGENERPYPMDWNNLAPSVGVAWTPSARRRVPSPRHRRDWRPGGSRRLRRRLLPQRPDRLPGPDRQ